MCALGGFKMYLHVWNLFPYNSFKFPIHNISRPPPSCSAPYGLTKSISHVIDSTKCYIVGCTYDRITPTRDSKLKRDSNCFHFTVFLMCFSPSIQNYNFIINLRLCDNLCGVLLFIFIHLTFSPFFYAWPIPAKLHVIKFTY